MSLRATTTYALVLALLATQRLLELRLSRQNERALPAPRERTADPPGNFALMVGVHAALLAGSGLESGLRGAVAPPLVWGPSLILLSCAQALRLWVIASLGPSWNTRGRVSARLRVVSVGPYRWVRHPNYLAVLVEFLAIPAAGGAWITLLLLNPLHVLVLRRRLCREEALLRGVPGYERAMGAKGALLPRLWPRGSSTR